jgi:hypothetical protein
VETNKIDEEKENQKSIGINGVRKMTSSVNYLELKKEFYKKASKYIK